MAMENFSAHQQKIIKRYYQNIDGIQLQRLSELAGELYLCEGKKLAKAWATIATLLEKMEIPQARREHILKEAKPELVANLVKELSA